MNIIHDDFLNNKCTFTLVTGNSSFDKKGLLVMGKGATLDFKKRFPEEHKQLSILAQNKMVTGQYYGLVIYKTKGVFQVKYFWGEPALLDLIRSSTNELIKFSKSHRDWTFAMNFPGIGAGNLAIEDVMPIVSKLPDNVYLYIKE